MKTACITDTLGENACRFLRLVLTDCVFCLCVFAIIVTVDHIFRPQVEYIFQKAALQNPVGTLT